MALDDSRHGSRNRRQADGDSLSLEDDFEDDLELHDPSKRDGQSDQSMSITDDDSDNSSMHNHGEHHITLFGEIKHDDGNLDSRVHFQTAR